jgi:hypothetical protein
MSPATRQLLAKRFLGTVKTGEYIDWALTELEAGADTRNLRVLAGLSPLDSHFEVEFYFQRALHDRGFELPNEDTHLEQYVREVLRGVVSGEIEPSDGWHQVYTVWLALDYPAHLADWVLLADGLEPGTYRDLEGGEFAAAARREAERLLQIEGSLL